MTQQSSQAGMRPEGFLASMSRWAMALPVIPLLTGLSFVASTYLALVCADPTLSDLDYSDFGFSATTSATLLVLGIGLGFPLRWALMRIRDTGRVRAGPWVLLGVGAIWVLASFAQLVLFFVGGWASSI